MKPAERDHLHTLLSAVVDGTIGEDQAAEVVRMLAADADARRFYVRYLDMHAALAEVAARPAAPSRGRFPWVAIVATLMAASVLLAWLLLPLRGPARVPAAGETGDVATVEAAAPSYVATVASVGGRPLLNGEPTRAGTRLTPGPYVVATGSVMVRFDGGARVLFDGDARFTLRSRRAMRIDQGTFVFEGDQSCESIEIATPHSVFRNIGTRYAAVIEADAEEVHVAEGAVRRTTGTGPRPPRHELIEAGAGRRYAAEDAAAESIPLDEALVAKPFDEARAPTGADLPAVVDRFEDGQEHLDGLRSGHGWAEPWRSPRGGFALVTPGLTGEGSVAVRHDGVGKDPAARRSAAHRRLATPIDLSRDGVWYLRFHIRRGPAAPNDEHRAMVVLRAHGASAEDEVDRGSLVQIALRRDDKAMIRLADTLTRVSLPQAPGQAYVVIAKIVAGRAKPDQVLVRLAAADRLADLEEPSDWSFVSDSVQSDVVLDQVSLECVSRGRVEFGDVCIGPTWESVTGAAVGP